MIIEYTPQPATIAIDRKRTKTYQINGTMLTSYPQAEHTQTEMFRYNILFFLSVQCFTSCDVVTIVVSQSDSKCQYTHPATTHPFVRTQYCRYVIHPLCSYCCIYPQIYQFFSSLLFHIFRCKCVRCRLRLKTTESREMMEEKKKTRPSCFCCNCNTMREIIKLLFMVLCCCCCRIVASSESISTILFCCTTNE